MKRFEETKLRRAVSLILRRAGSDEREAEIVTDHLVRANLAGHDSHGVGMIPTYMRNLKAGRLFANRHVDLVKDDGAFLMFDGRLGYGQVQGKEAMEAAIARCADIGLVLMTLRNAHHIGRIGSYGEQSGAAGLVSLHFVNVVDHDPVVAPYGGVKSRFITNPVCIAMPGTTTTDAIVLDMATSKIAMGKARVAMNMGVGVPEGSLLDADGTPTTDPNALFATPPGALLPFGDHKGSGLALLCELLGGGLSGGGTIQPGNPRRGGLVNNMFTLVIDPGRLVDRTWLASEIDSLVNYVRSTPPSAHTGPVRVAGDPERETAAERRRLGVPLADAAWEGIVQAGEEVGATREEVAAIVA